MLIFGREEGRRDTYPPFDTRIYTPLSASVKCKKKKVRKDFVFKRGYGFSIIKIVKNSNLVPPPSPFLLL